MIEVC